MRTLRTTATANRGTIAAADRLQAVMDNRLRSLERHNRFLEGLNRFLLAMIPFAIGAGLILGRTIAG
jgi:hypothetical protein